MKKIILLLFLAMSTFTFANYSMNKTANLKFETGEKPGTVKIVCTITDNLSKKWKVDELILEIEPFSTDKKLFNKKGKTQGITLKVTRKLLDNEFAYYRCAYKVLWGTLASRDIRIRRSDLKVLQN
jgi:hypothetical protein